MKIHHVKARLNGAFCPTGVGAVLTHLAPFRMFIGGEVVHACGEVDRRIDAGFLGGVVLFAEKIKAQMGMHFSHRGRVVAPAMVTL